MPALESVTAVLGKAVENADVVGEKVGKITTDEVKEITSKGIELDGQYHDFVIEKLSDIKSMSPEHLWEYMENNLSTVNSESVLETDENIGDKEGLNDEQKQKIKEEKGWSNDIINSIGSWEEYKIYRDAELVEVEIGGKKCLIRNDIDWNQLDEKGRTNSQRIQEGKAPLDKNGESIQLHHIGQHTNSPLAELTFVEHRSNGNDIILHDKLKETEVHVEGNTWNTERDTYWKARYIYNYESGE